MDWGLYSDLIHKHDSMDDALDFRQEDRKCKAREMYHLDEEDLLSLHNGSC